MAKEIGFENGRNSNFQGLVTLTLTLDPAIRHIVVHHSSTSIYIPNFIEIKETFSGRTDGRTDGHFPPLILLGRLLKVDLIKTDNNTDLSHFFLQSWTTACASSFQSSTCNSDIFRIQKQLKDEHYELYIETWNSCHQV